MLTGAGIERACAWGGGALPQVVLLFVVEAQNGVFGVGAWIVVVVEKIGNFCVQTRRKRVAQVAEGDAVWECCARFSREGVAACEGQRFPEGSSAVGLCVAEGGRGEGGG